MKVWVKVAHSEPGAVRGDRLTANQLATILDANRSLSTDDIRAAWWAQRNAPPARGPGPLGSPVRR